MSTGARVQFIRVDPSDQARMTSWIHHISRLTGIPAKARSRTSHTPDFYI